LLGDARCLGLTRFPGLLGLALFLSHASCFGLLSLALFLALAIFGSLALRGSKGLPLGCGLFLAALTLGLLLGNALALGLLLTAKLGLEPAALCSGGRLSLGLKLLATTAGLFGFTGLFSLALFFGLASSFCPPFLFAFPCGLFGTPLGLLGSLLGCGFFGCLLSRGLARCLLSGGLGRSLAIGLGFISSCLGSGCAALPFGLFGGSFLCSRFPSGFFTSSFLGRCLSGSLLSGSFLRRCLAGSLFASSLLSSRLFLGCLPGCSLPGSLGGSLAVCFSLVASRLRLSFALPSLGFFPIGFFLCQAGQLFNASRRCELIFYGVNSRRRGSVFACFPGSSESFWREVINGIRYLIQ